MRILLVEDDPHTAGFIAKGLREDGHSVDHADNGKDGLFLATTEIYDAIVLDRMLPQLDGMTVLKTLRGADNRTPALLLTALGDVEHRVEGLRAGADDYLVKSFSYACLSARLDPLARRGTGGGGGPVRETRDSAGLTRSTPCTDSRSSTCLPSRQVVTTVVTNNWLPFVFGPALAIESKYGRSCLSWKFSSANLFP